MKTPNFLIDKEGGYKNIPPNLVKERTTKFVMKTRNTAPDKLREPWKGCVCYTLIQFYGWDFKDVSEFLKYSTKTVRKDFQAARDAYSLTALLSKNSVNGAKFIYDLRDYIYYNMYRR
jgi:hypothetical protein